MARVRSPRGRLAVAGLDPDRAAKLFAAAGLWPLDAEGSPSFDSDQVIADEVWAVVDACAWVASPDDAVKALTDLAGSHPAAFVDLVGERDWLWRAAAVAGTSRPLGQLLAQHPSALRAIERPSRVSAEQIATSVELAVRQAEGTENRARAVATVRRHVTAAIASRDLMDDAPVDEVAADLSSLAEGVLHGTLTAVHDTACDGRPRSRIAVIGMGKLGGQELNYVSDVDVIYVHEAIDGASAPEAAEEATQVLTVVMAILNASTTMGRAYEIDPTLRPEGRQGALSRTIAGFEAYWDRWAKTWEFQALLKARPVAGDRELGERFLSSAEAHVWPEHLDPLVVDEIRRMKARVEAKPEVRRDGDRQVKLGPGGLRDIEFAVQLLQLVHGRHDRRLRVTGTLPALTALATGGYVADEDASAFADAYRHLRRVEHRLQLANERRTHTIPEGDEQHEWLARSLGHRGTEAAPARVAFLQELRQVQATVRGLHAKLFYRPLLEAHAAVPASDGRLTLPGQIHVMGADAAHERMRALGFRDPVAAMRHVSSMTGGMSRSSRAVRAALPAMLQRLAESPDPDLGVRMLRQVLDAHSAAARLAPRLRDHPPSAELLARVLGTSQVAGELFAVDPRGVDWLTDEAVRTTARTREELSRTALARLGWQDRDAALRRFKRTELLRIVLRDLAGWSDQGTTSRELTALGEACLEAGLHAVLADVMAESDLDEAPADVTIIGMGKLGGAELHYCSDLDVLFVHRPRPGADPTDANRFATRVAEQVMKSLGAITSEGTAFEVDADLRPEGRSGPLSRSLDAYANYYGRWSDAWEHQALLRARPVAGDVALGDDFLATIAPLAAPRDMDDEHLLAIRKLKARIEKERVPRRADPARHLKMGPGGLADVEWTVQLLQLIHGHATPEVLVPGTLVALERLQAADALSADDARILAEGYDHLSQVRNRLYLQGERSVDELPRPGPDGTELLARSLGFERGAWQQFEQEHARHRRRIRNVCERVFFGMPPDDGSGDG